MATPDPNADEVRISIEPASSADANWCLRQYQEELARRFDNGFDPSTGNSLDPADVTPPRGWFVVAKMGGRAVGCGALKRLDGTSGEIKRVWVADDARGMRLASRIMDRLEEISAEAGFEKVLLDTNRALTEARAMYLKRGYAEIAPYNDNPYAHHWFEKRL
ncbi:MAG: GNAT family N-acetyltransferase [Mesorhizobium sp.]|nr:GNAT family N-acetyltransferase [Mesorhizobium sp.]